MPPPVIETDAKRNVKYIYDEEEVKESQVEETPKTKPPPIVSRTKERKYIIKFNTCFLYGC